MLLIENCKKKKAHYCPGPNKLRYHFFIGNFNLMNRIELKLELLIMAVFELH